MTVKVTRRSAQTDPSRLQGPRETVAERDHQGFGARRCNHWLVAAWSQFFTRVVLPLLAPFVSLRGEITAIVVADPPAYSGITLKASYAQSLGSTGYPSASEQTARMYMPPEFVLSA